MKPDLKKGLETCVDADFSGAHDEDSSEDTSIAHSRAGFVIKHATFTMTWKSKLQIEIALSTTEAKHAILSTALKEAMPTMQLLRELHVVMYVKDCDKSMMCIVFEENNGAI